ncbi:MAG: M18 family aminopeptidase, partial [Myxococcales bacterium]
MLLDGLLDDLLDYLRLSPTPFHAVENACHRLQGFTRLDQTAAWSPLAPGRYFVVHEDSALVAFVIPDTPAVRAFRIVVAHTDSPNLRLKPNASYAKEGYLQLGVEVYGGVLLNSWLDRDLGLAGRAVVRAADGALSSRLFCIHRPLASVAQLAIHLDRDVNDKGITLNRQQHLPPIVALAGKTEVGAVDELCAEVLGVAPSSIVAMDRMLFDIAPPCLGGLRNDFVFAARLDNLAMCHAATLALNNASPSEAVSLVALF